MHDLDRELRESCLESGLCSAEQLDAAMRLRDERRASGSSDDLLDALAASGALDDEQVALLRHVLPPKPVVADHGPEVDDAPSSEWMDFHQAAVEVVEGVGAPLGPPQGGLGGALTGPPPQQASSSPSPPPPPPTEELPTGAKRFAGDAFYGSHSTAPQGAVAPPPGNPFDDPPVPFAAQAAAEQSASALPPLPHPSHGPALGPMQGPSPTLDMSADEIERALTGCLPTDEDDRLGGLVGLMPEELDDTCDDDGELPDFSNVAPGATVAWSSEEMVGEMTVHEVAPRADSSPQAAAPEEDPAADELIGTTLGNCRIERELGRGAMGVVYEGRHTKLDRRVAVKVLRPVAGNSNMDVGQFMREARALAQVEHPNIVQVYDVGSEGDTHFIVMQLLDGSNVADLLRARRRLDDREACRIARETAAGLAVAHKKGIVHRDIKPENLMLTSEMDVKVADFGLAAKPAEEGGDARREIMGTPAYMAPEQIDGRPVDGRTDLYALGCTLYEMLAGKKPFEGESAVEVLLKQTRESAVPVHQVAPEIPLPVSRLIEKLMAKHPGARYARAEDVVRDLDSILGGGKPQIVVEIESVMNRMQALAEMQPASIPKSRPYVTVAAGFVLVAVAAIASSFALPSLTPPQLEAARVQRADPAVVTAGARVLLDEILRVSENRPIDVTEHCAALDALASEHGAVLGAQIGVARDTVQARYTQLRYDAIESISDQARALREADDPVSAVKVLLTLEPTFRQCEEAMLWTDEVVRSLDAVTSTTHMAFVPGGPGADGVVTAPFLLDLTEVSNADYAQFVEATGARPPVAWSGSRPPQRQRHLPVVGVTSAEADAYASWAGKRLPTAAEWERGARGAQGNRYPWGDAFDPNRCVSRSSAATDMVGVRDIGAGRSLCGAYHMAGNAAEWTADEVTLGDGTAARIVRGGSARSHAENVTGHSGYPLAENTQDPALLVGFRCARDVP